MMICKMKKVIIIVLLFMQLSQEKVEAQTQLRVTRAVVSNINEHLSKNEINEEKENGPYVNLDCLVENRTANDIMLHPSRADYSFCYSYNGQNFKQKMFPLLFMDNDKLVLHPGETVTFTVGLYIFLGTPILKKNKDYALDLLKSVPSGRVEYQDGVNNLISRGMDHVSLK